MFISLYQHLHTPATPIPLHRLQGNIGFYRPGYRVHQFSRIRLHLHVGVVLRLHTLNPRHILLSALWRQCFPVHPHRTAFSILHPKHVLRTHFNTLDTKHWGRTCCISFTFKATMENDAGIITLQRETVVVFEWDAPASNPYSLILSGITMSLLNKVTWLSSEDVKVIAEF